MMDPPRSWIDDVNWRRERWRDLVAGVRGGYIGAAAADREKIRPVETRQTRQMGLAVAAISWGPWDRLLRERFQPDQTAETAPEAVYHGAPSFSQIQIKIAQFPVFAAGPSDGDAERDRSYVVALYCVFSAENP